MKSFSAGIEAPPIVHRQTPEKTSRRGPYLEDDPLQQEERNELQQRGRANNLEQHVSRSSFCASNVIGLGKGRYSKARLLCVVEGGGAGDSGRSKPYMGRAMGVGAAPCVASGEGEERDLYVCVCVCVCVCVVCVCEWCVCGVCLWSVRVGGWWLVGR